MGVRRFEDLVAWQLAQKLQQEVFAFTADPPTNRDFKFCNQIQESSRSAPRNIGEGFGRYYHKDFSRFLRFAAGSLHETKNHLHHACDKGFLTTAKHEEFVRLCLRAIKANARLMRYLNGSQDPPFDSS